MGKAIISNMREIAALVEAFERRDLCTKQNLVNTVIELRKESAARIPEAVFPSGVTSNL